jgi:hypothetical protein
VTSPQGQKLDYSSNIREVNIHSWTKKPGHLKKCDLFLYFILYFILYYILLYILYIYNKSEIHISSNSLISFTQVDCF